MLFLVRLAGVAPLTLLESGTTCNVLQNGSTRRFGAAMAQSRLKGSDWEFGSIAGSILPIFDLRVGCMKGNTRHGRQIGLLAQEGHFSFSLPATGVDRLQPGPDTVPLMGEQFPRRDYPSLRFRAAARPSSCPVGPAKGAGSGKLSRVPMHYRVQLL
jgi:hypothetical protein